VVAGTGDVRGETVRQRETGRGTMAAREAWLAYGMFAPTFLIVLAVVLFPLFANFWISVKPVGLEDLRAPTPLVNPRVRGDDEAVGDRPELQYRLRSSSPDRSITDVVLRDQLPAGLVPIEIDERCSLDDRQLQCDLGDWEGGYRETLTIPVEVAQDYLALDEEAREPNPTITGKAANPLLSGQFTLDNFRRVLDAREFWNVLWVTFAYTIFGTLGSLILGLFAAQLLNSSFRGRTVLRGLFLFPYVAPVIAVAFTWVFLLDPFSGTINALTARLGLTAEPINYLGTRTVPIEFLGLTLHFPLALAMVIAFEAWRYFPLAFLFILARLQALPTDVYESAEIDGATPLQTFYYVTLPQLAGILSVLFLLRFIWTFNKFDDIFLLTGGAAGTRTLTVSVYEQGFALANLGAGAAVSVVIFFALVIFATLHFRFAPKEQGL
jgi:multiple sugar transport system permease protein